jgi:hypothetical protein
VSNIITIEFFNKKHFPPGVWLKEPDLCSWQYANLSCLAVRDMSMGIWKGFVGLDQDHPLYDKNINYIVALPQALELFGSVHGGLSGVGKLSVKYKSYAKNYWWIGIETSQGDDLMPLLKLDQSDTDMTKLLSIQTYKDLHFIRRETNKLAKQLIKLQ